VDLQACRAATVTTMEHSTMLASTATGGVLQRIIQPSPGSAAWTTPVAVSSGAASLSGAVILFVASGTNLFDYLIIYREAVKKFKILALFSDLPVYKATYDFMIYFLVGEKTYWFNGKKYQAFNSIILESNNVEIIMSQTN
jgi:hypothetical protein